MDKLHAMQQFMRVAEAKSFSVAARQLDVSPSAVSKVITNFEKELGFALFHRSTRHLSVTAAGGAYLERCREIFRAMEQARQMPHNQMIVVCLSGRGDKDAAEIARLKAAR